MGLLHEVPKGRRDSRAWQAYVSRRRRRNANTVTVTHTANAGTMRMTIPVSMVRMASLIGARGSVEPQRRESQGVRPDVVQHYKREHHQRHGPPQQRAALVLEVHEVQQGHGGFEQRQSEQRG